LGATPWGRSSACHYRCVVRWDCGTDIGTLFPPSDPQWKSADSVVFLQEALRRVASAGYAVTNLDSTLILNAPKIGPHAAEIRSRVAALLGIPEDCVGLKAKTPEGPEHR